MILEIECDFPSIFTSLYFDVPYSTRYLVRTRAHRSIETLRIHRTISKRVELILGSDNGTIYWLIVGSLQNSAIFDQYGQIFGGFMDAYAFRSQTKGWHPQFQHARRVEKRKGHFQAGIKRTRIPTGGWNRMEGGPRTRQRDSSYLRNLRESGLNTMTRPNRFLCRAIYLRNLRIIVAYLVIVAHGWDSCFS